MRLHLKTGEFWIIDRWTAHPIHSDIFIALLPGDQGEITFTAQSLNFIQDFPVRAPALTHPPSLNEDREAEGEGDTHTHTHERIPGSGLSDFNRDDLGR